MLDTLLESGIFPTYLFPKHLVGFYIEDKCGSKIVEKPDRTLDVAISEYAPGHIVVVNKNTYKSGGVYNFHSKFKLGEQDNPTRQYFNSKDYFRSLYYCKDSSCNWMGLKDYKRCPFCGQQTIKQNSISDLGDLHL